MYIKIEANIWNQLWFYYDSVACSNSIKRYTYTRRRRRRRRSKSQLGCAMRIAASGSKAIVPFQVHDYGAVVSNGLNPPKIDLLVVISQKNSTCF